MVVRVCIWTSVGLQSICATEELDDSLFLFKETVAIGVIEELGVDWWAQKEGFGTSRVDSRLGAARERKVGKSESIGWGEAKEQFLTRIWRRKNQLEETKLPICELTRESNQLHEVLVWFGLGCCEAEEVTSTARSDQVRHTG